MANILERSWNSLGLNMTIFSLSLARMGDGMGNSLLFVVIPLYVSRLPEEFIYLPRVLLIGILVSIYGFSNAALQPFMAALSDRVGHFKRIIQGGLLLICLATLGFAFARSYIDLFGLRIVQGLGLAMEIPPTLALLGIVTRKETRGSAMGFFTTLRMLGLGAGPLLGGYLLDNLGFDSVFYAGAVVLLLAAVMVQFGVKNVEDPASKGGHCAPVVDFSLLNRGIVSAAFATFVMASAFTLVSTLENEINARLHISAFGFSIAFSALLAGRLIFQVPLGRLSDRLGRRPFVLWGLVALAPLTALLAMMPTLLSFTMLRFAQGIAAGAIVAPALAFAGDVAQAGKEGSRSRQMSVVTIGFGLGIAFGPLLAGAMGLVSFELPFFFDGFLCLIAATVVYFYMNETVERKKDA